MSTGHQPYAQSIAAPAAYRKCPICLHWFLKKRGGFEKHWQRCSHTNSEGSTRKRTREQSTDCDSDAGSSSLPPSLRSPSPQPLHKRRRVNVLDDEAEGPMDDRQQEEQGTGSSVAPTGRCKVQRTRPLQLADGQVWRERHPSSGQLSEIHELPTIHSSSIPVLPRSFEHEAKPWHTFHTRANFEQAEIFVRYAVTDPHINQQLSLNQRAAENTQITMKNASDFHRLLGNIVSADSADNYTREEINVQYPRGNATRRYTIYRKDILPIVQDIMEDETLADRLHIFPERHYVAKPGGGTMRIWDEASSGDDWYILQTKVGPSSFAVYMQLYVDATHVTALGNIKYWGVYLWLGNVPKADRNDTGGRGRARLVGFLPIVDGLQTDTQGDIAHHRAEVYHQAFVMILNDVRVPAEIGTYLNVRALHINVKGQLICAVVTCDYEEMCRVSGILGPQSGYPCPSCLVPTDCLFDLVQGDKWPMRDVQESQELIDIARKQPTKTKKREVLQQQSLRPIDNAFGQVFGGYFNIFAAFVLDPLHQIEQGEWGRHWWPWLLAVLSGPAKNAIDECFVQAPPFPDTRHFVNGVTGLKFLTGKEQGQILEYICPYITGLGLKHQTMILKALRALAVAYLLTKSFKVHSELTLDDLDHQVETYDQWTKKLRMQSGFDIDFNWPKHHSLAHASEIIRAKGPSDNYETGLGERLHPQVKKDYRRSSKRPASVTNEMMRMAQEREAILRVRAQVDQYDAYAEALEDQKAAEIAGDSARTRAKAKEKARRDERVVLGAPERHLCLLRDILDQLSDVEKPRMALKRLAGYLRDEHSLNIADEAQLSACMARRFYLLYVRFVCMMSYSLCVDTIRANPDWQNRGPRHDGILINVGDKEYEFGRVRAFLALGVRGQQLELAYVQRFRTIGRHKASNYIQIIPTSHDFISVETIERMFDIIPPSKHNKYYTVQDLKPDLYLRLKDTIR